MMCAVWSVAAPRAAAVAVLRQAWLQELRDQAGPAGLMGRADAAARVAVEVLVEQYVVAEVRIALQLRVLAEPRPHAAFVLEEQPLQPRRDLVGDLVDRAQPTGTCPSPILRPAAKCLICRRSYGEDLDEMIILLLHLFRLLPSLVGGHR